MNLVKIAGVYHAKYRDAEGRQKSVTTRCSNETEARQVVKDSGLATLELAAKSGRLTNEVVSRITTGKKITMDKALESYTKWLETVGKSPKTISNSVFTIHAWLSDMKLGNLPPMAIDESRVNKWINDPKSDNKANTRKTNLATLRPFFRFLLSKGWINSNPADLVRVNLDHLTHTQKEVKEKETFNPQEIMRILADCEERDDTFWQFAVQCAYETGLRLGDICQLEWHCFDKERVLTVWTDKRNKRLELPISATLARLITEIPVDDNQYVFPCEREKILDVAHRNNFSVQFKRMCERLGIKNKTFHCIRHTVATEKYANVDKEKLAKKLAETLTLSQIASLLGHSETGTTKGYIHD